MGNVNNIGSGFFIPGSNKEIPLNMLQEAFDSKLPLSDRSESDPIQDHYTFQLLGKDLHVTKIHYNDKLTTFQPGSTEILTGRYVDLFLHKAKKAEVVY